MKLSVRIVDVHGVKKIMLCDEHGEPLPDQAGCSVRNEVDNVATVDVSFFIGRDVTLG